MHHFYKEYFTVGLSLARLRIDAAFFYKNPKSSKEKLTLTPVPDRAA